MRYWLGVALISLALALAGCGSSDDETANASEGTSSDAAMVEEWESLKDVSAGSLEWRCVEKSSRQIRFVAGPSTTEQVEVERGTAPFQEARLQPGGALTMPAGNEAQIWTVKTITAAPKPPSVISVEAGDGSCQPPQVTTSSEAG